MDIIADTGRWLAGLDPTFAFLLALPFAVGAAGLLAGWLETRSKRRQRQGDRLRRAAGDIAQVR
jgi:hypothetical protein